MNLIPNQDIINDNEEGDSSMNGVNEDEETDNQFETRINNIYNSISEIIANEKNKIKTKRDIIQKARNDFNQFKKIELEKLELKKKELKNLFQLKNNKKENDILDLNIGGTHSITTSRNTLIKYKNSALATLFTERAKDKNIKEIKGWANMNKSFNKRKNNNNKFDKSPENFKINMNNINITRRMYPIPVIRNLAREISSWSNGIYRARFHKITVRESRKEKILSAHLS